MSSRTGACLCLPVPRGARAGLRGQRLPSGGLSSGHVHSEGLRLPDQEGPCDWRKQDRVMTQWPRLTLLLDHVLVLSRASDISQL